MLAKDVMIVMNELAPEYLIDKTWDNSGVQIGNLNKKVENILISLDVTPSTIYEAINKKADMIITHHPFFFTPVNEITTDNIRGRMIYDIIKNDIVVFSAHSNLDMCKNSVSRIVSNELGLKDVSILSETYTEKLYKIVVFVPITHSELVRNAMLDNDAGHIGNYSHCSFNIEGVGTFIPREESNPFIGKQNCLEFVKEERIETIVTEYQLDKVIKSMLCAHPYEEVAYDIYPLSNIANKYGYGTTGYLPKDMTLEEFAHMVKKKLTCETIRLYGNKNRKIKKVAICGGSGSDFINEAYRNKADVYVTGDIKYHDAQFALELDMPIIDANHYDTEKLVLPYLKSYLDNHFENKLNFFVHQENGAPFSTI